jgi:hypothetical protein
MTWGFIKLWGILLRHEKIRVVSSAVSKSFCDEHLIINRSFQAQLLKTLSRNMRHMRGGQSVPSAGLHSPNGSRLCVLVLKINGRRLRKWKKSVMFRSAHCP